MKHSDLAVESAHIPAGTSGTRCVSRTIGGVKITDIRLSNYIETPRAVHHT